MNRQTFEDVSEIPSHEQYKLQCVLEDIMLTDCCPQWVLDIHAAIMRDLDKREASNVCKSCDGTGYTFGLTCLSCGGIRN